MRISTQMLHESGASTLTAKQRELYRLQQQIASGKRIVTPADDPVGAARSATLRGALAANQQHARAQDAAREGLALAESTLGEVGEVMQVIRERLVQANSPVLSTSDRATLVQSLRGAYEQLIALANAHDGSGRYLFGGFRDAGAPFAKAGGSVVYGGDGGVRELQVGPGRRLAVGASGDEIFMRARTGNGVIDLTASPANTGGAVIGSAQVADASALTGDDYRVVFAVSGGQVTYDVLDLTTSTTVVSGAAYAPGGAIEFHGVRLALQGTPAAGDAFDLRPSRPQSIFDTVARAIAALEAPAGSATGASRANALAEAMANVDGAMDVALTVRGRLGSALAEIDALAAGTASRDVSLQGELSALNDLDYARAVTAYTSEQQSLQAARDAYAMIARMSLFDIL